MSSRFFEIRYITPIIILISIVWYYPFLDNYFMFDDYFIFEFNSIGDLKERLLGYRNLRILIPFFWQFFYRTFGENPFGYNLISVACHLLNSIVLYFFLRNLIKDDFISGMTTVLFAASAAGADAVFWKAALATLVVFSLYLAVLFFYIQWRRSGERKYWIFALLFFTAGMLTKEIIASVPFTILLIELVFFDGRKNLFSIARRLIPFIIIIVTYIAMSLVFARILDIRQGNFETLGAYNPLHSLAGGFTAFFIAPDGRMNREYVPLYIFLLFAPLSYLLVKDKRLLYFGYGWVFLTFLPQSFATIISFDAPNFVNSISRHLYQVSVGSSLVFVVVLNAFRSRLGKKAFIAFACLSMGALLAVNYARVQSRGNQWKLHGSDNKRFLTSLYDAVPFMGGKTFIYVVDGPVGRAFVQSALRAHHKNRDIYWVEDGDKKLREIKRGESLYYLYYNPKCIVNPDCEKPVRATRVK